jgi:Holliday junction resolvase RusA-like endonuclease
MIKLVFTGRPISKDNEKIANRQGRFFLSAKYKNYARDIQIQFCSQLPNFTPIEKEIIMTMTFYFEDKRCLDLSNAPKSICDALQNFLYKNDKQICELHLFKKFDKNNPRVEIVIDEK